MKSGQYGFFCGFVSIPPKVGLISSNLLCILLFQCCCLSCSMYLFIFILKSEYGILNLVVSTVSSQTWTQHICTSLSFDKFSNFHRIFINGLPNFLFLKIPTPIEKSEKLMNLLFLNFKRSRAM